MKQEERQRRWRIVGIFKISKITVNSFPYFFISLEITSERSGAFYR